MGDTNAWVDVLGLVKTEPISGYHNHEIGHTFDRTPHFNAWSESTGTSFKNNVHLYYE